MLAKGDPKTFRMPISRYFKAGPRNIWELNSTTFDCWLCIFVVVSFCCFFHFEGLRKKGGAQKGKTTRRKNTNTTTETKSWGEYCARRFPSDGKY